MTQSSWIVALLSLSLALAFLSPGGGALSGSKNWQRSKALLARGAYANWFEEARPGGMTAVHVAARPESGEGEIPRSEPGSAPICRLNPAAVAADDARAPGRSWEHSVAAKTGRRREHDERGRQ